MGDEPRLPPGVHGARLSQAARVAAYASPQARGRTERAPVPPLVGLHVAPLVLAVLGALQAVRLDLRTRRARTTRQRPGLAGVLRALAPLRRQYPRRYARCWATAPRSRTRSARAAPRSASAPRCAARRWSGSCRRPGGRCPAWRALPGAAPRRAPPRRAGSCPSRRAEERPRVTSSPNAGGQNAERADLGARAAAAACICACRSCCILLYSAQPASRYAWRQ